MLRDAEHVIRITYLHTVTNISVLIFAKTNEDYSVKIELVVQLLWIPRAYD